MNQQERAILVWSIFFVISGLFFMLAFAFFPLVGAIVTSAYIILYVGLSAVFIMVFREIAVLRKDTLESLKDKKEELEEVEKALKGKYFKKKIDDSSYRSMVQDYEKMITELEVKIKRLKRKK
jgi:uncharacterized membrane protein